MAHVVSVEGLAKDFSTQEHGVCACMLSVHTLLTPLLCPAVAGLVAEIQAAPELKGICLSGNTFTFEAVKSVAEALAEKPHIEVGLT